MYITKIQALKFVTSLESSIIAKDGASGELLIVMVMIILDTSLYIFFQLPSHICQEW